MADKTQPSTLAALSTLTESHLTTILSSSRSFALRRKKVTSTSSRSVVLTLADVNAALRAAGEEEVYGDVLGGVGDDALMEAVSESTGPGVDLNAYISSHLSQTAGPPPNFTCTMDWIAVDGVSTTKHSLINNATMPPVLSSLLLAIDQPGKIPQQDFDKLLSRTLKALPSPSLTSDLLPKLIPLLATGPALPRVLTTLHSLLLALDNPPMPFLTSLHRLLPPLLTLATDPTLSLPLPSRIKVVTILRTIGTLTETTVPTLRSRMISKAHDLFLKHLTNLKTDESPTPDHLDAASCTLKLLLSPSLSRTTRIFYTSFVEPLADDISSIVSEEARSRIEEVCKEVWGKDMDPVGELFV